MAIIKKGILTLFCVLALLFTQCKMDAPIYPDGSVTGAGTTTGTVTSDANGLSIGPENTVLFQIENGAVITITRPFLSVQMDGENPSYPNGYTQIDAIDPIARLTFRLEFKSAHAGTYTIHAININATSYNISNLDVGTVKAAQFAVTNTDIETKGTLTGQFIGQQVRLSDNALVNVKGSFNIKIQ